MPPFGIPGVNEEFLGNALTGAVQAATPNATPTQGWSGPTYAHLVQQAQQLQNQENKEKDPAKKAQLHSQVDQIMSQIDAQVKAAQAPKTSYGGLANFLGIYPGGAGSSQEAAKKAAAGAKPAAKPADPTQQQPAGPQTIFDPLNMQSLWNTVFAPYLAQVSKGYSDQIAQYGSAMNAALAKPMDPGIRAAYQAAIPGTQALMTNQNKALQGMAIAEPQFNTLLNELNQARQAAFTQAKAQANMAAMSPGLTGTTKVGNLNVNQLLGLTGGA